MLRQSQHEENLTSIDIDASTNVLILSLPASAEASAGLDKLIVRRSLGEGGSKDR